MVAAEEEGCSRMGVEILKKGGNAVDAAITSCLCIGTVNSFSSGIGGGGFMLIRAPGKARTSLVGGGELSWSTSSTYLNPENSPFLINITSPSASSSDNSTLIAIDFRETAPSLSSPSMYVTAPPGSSQVGGLSVGVPGEVRGLYTAWEMYGSGRVEWKDLVEPVAELAKGWRVGRELARRFRIYGSESEMILIFT
jgi:gamma-glutamyltranspeptidase/glutathione hydrolase/leukotriene-C4 hydrolase